jgi:hypothetical protein
VRTSRVIRFEDRLHFAFVLESLTLKWSATATIWELKSNGLNDDGLGQHYRR